MTDGMRTGDQFTSLFPNSAIVRGTVHRPEKIALHILFLADAFFLTRHGGTLDLLNFHIGHAAEELFSLRAQG